MNIDDLTLGQMKEIKKMIGGGNDAEKSGVPVEIGKPYLFRTVTHIELGLGLVEI